MSHVACGSDFTLLVQNHAMSHVQLVRAILHGLADPRSFSQGLFMQRGDPQGSPSATAPSQQAMREAFEVVFVDSSGWCNLAAHVSKSALRQVGFFDFCTFTCYMYVCVSFICNHRHAHL